MDFGRYLLRELTYQMDQWNITVDGLTFAEMEQIEVLSYKGYEQLSLRTPKYVIEATLDWSMLTPPILKIEQRRTP